MTFPLSVGATTVLKAERPTPDGVAALLRKHPVTVFFAVPTFYAAFLNSPNAPQKSEVKIRRCISAGEASAGGNRAHLEGALRRRDFRRARHHRDAAHLSDQRAGRDQIRHHRQGGAGLRDQADRRGRQAGEAGRDGRALCARADQRDHVLEQPREVALDLPGRMDPLGRQIYRGRRRLLHLLRPRRRHAESVGHVCLAVRGGGGAVLASGRAGSRAWSAGTTSRS